MKKTPLLAVGLMTTVLLTGCATKADGERNDKLESFNRTMFDFNYKSHGPLCVRTCSERLA